MAEDLKKEYGWYAKFNLKKLNLFKRIFYAISIFYNHYPSSPISFERKDIEKFIKATGAKVNYIYAHKFFTTYTPTFEGILDLKIKDWKHEIYLPLPELYQGDKLKRQKYYYFTLFHELIHWTGSEFHQKRFSLDQPIKTNQLTLAAEEIVAAFGCSLLMKKFELFDDDVNERIVLYVRDYAQSLIIQVAALNFIELHDGWTVNDYLNNEPFIRAYVAGLMLKAKKSVEYLESFQK